MKIRTEEHKRKIRLAISIALKGKHCSPKTEFQKGSIPWNKGKTGVYSKESISKMRGEKCHFWKGGIAPINDKIRMSIEMRLWRESVFARDNWTCLKCKIRGGKLCSHHIQNFSQFPELRTSIENGLTFCRKCHIKLHKIYGKKNNTKKQIDEFTKK